MTEPKIQPSTDAEWRAYYEEKCRAQRKEIDVLVREAVAAEREACKSAVLKFLSAKGHDLCHENRQELALAFGIEPNDFTQGLPPEAEFERRCHEFRQQLYGCDGPEPERARLTAP